MAKKLNEGVEKPIVEPPIETPKEEKPTETRSETQTIPEFHTGVLCSVTDIESGVEVLLKFKGSEAHEFQLGELYKLSK